MALSRSRTWQGFLATVAVLVGSISLAAGAGAAEETGGAAVYWSNFGGNVLSSAQLNGTGGGNLGPFTGTGVTVSSPAGTAIDAVGGSVYWANSTGGTTGTGALLYARLNGPGGVLDTTGATVDEPRGLALDPLAKRVFWANSAGGPGGNGSISWAAMGGASTPGGGDLISGPQVTSPEGVAVDPSDGMIYWANSAGSGPGPGSGSIMVATVNGTDAASVPITGATVNAPNGLALDPETATLYWTNGPAGIQPGSISYWNLDTGTGGDLVTDAPVDHPQGIAIDPVAGRLYWANAGNDTIAYANLDGSSGGTLSTTAATVNDPMYPVLLVAPVATRPPEVTGTLTVGSQLTCQKATWAGDIASAFYYRAVRNSDTWAWSRDGSDIAGATGQTYTPTVAGTYTCSQLGKNHAGTTKATSEPFIVGGPPAASTGKASSVGATTAVLGGSVNPEYAATTYHFEYGPTIAYGSRMPAGSVSVGSDGANYPVATPISGLQPNRTYHFRLVAENSNGTTYGADETFSTISIPVVSTGAAKSISTLGAVLTGTVNPENLAARYHFEFGTTTAYGFRVPVSGAAAGSDVSDHAVSQSISGLQPDTVYHFRLVAQNAAGTSYGADRSFRTLAPPRLRVRGRVGTIGASLRLKLTCAGAPGQQCDAAVSVRTFEKLSRDGRRIIGLSATRPHGRRWAVVVASRTLHLNAAQRRQLTLRLNHSGRALRWRFGRLPATVSVRSTFYGHTRTVRSARVTFGADPPRLRIVGSPSTRRAELHVMLSCAGTSSQQCAGTLSVTTVSALGKAGATGSAPADLTIAGHHYRLSTGTTSRCTLALSARGKALLSRYGRIPANLTITLKYNSYTITQAGARVTFTR